MSAKSLIWLISEGTHPRKLDVCKTSIARSSEVAAAAGCGGWLLHVRFGSKADIAISSHRAPLYLQKRTFAGTSSMSSKCQ